MTLRELAPNQRRELGSILAAGVTSSALFLVAFLVALEPAPLRSEPIAMQVAAVVDMPRGFVPPARGLQSPAGPSRVRQARGGRPLETRRAGTPSLTTHASTPTLTARNAGGVLTLASFTPASAVAQTAPSKQRRGLSRLLLGTGRYRVQPFPTPTEQN